MADGGHNLSPWFGEFLPAWVSKQRWYAGKGRLPAADLSAPDQPFELSGQFRLEDPDGEVGVGVWIVTDRSGPSPTVYQVPLTYRGAPLAGAEQALVTTAEHRLLGPRWIYDAPHDPVFTSLLLTMIATGTTSNPERDQGASAVGRRPALADATAGTDLGASFGQLVSSRVLGGEQSNTSFICELRDDDGREADPLIVKVFRVLHHGENPDVVVQSALAAAGSTRVPRLAGWVSGRWPDEDAPDGIAAGDLAFAQQFFPGVEDAWRVALAAIAAGEDFAERARSLGLATAEVHATLAATLPTTAADPETKAELVHGLRVRHAAAVHEVPSLGAYDAAIGAVFTAAEQADWPVLQRIHGDYHMGQVLDVPGRGWVLLDFEGEPIRPLAERSKPDLALRDVAGMLRSFDYAAGSWEQQNPGSSAAHWAESARQAFLDGYAEGSGRDPRAETALLSAMELDKALYEVVYEARNRPTWMGIPTTAIARLSVGRRSETSS